MRATLCACFLVMATAAASAQDDMDRPFIEGRVLSVEPAEAKPGDPVVAKVEVSIPEGYHIYPLEKSKAGFPTKIDVKSGPVAATGKQKQPAGKQFGTEQDGYTAHVGKVVFEVPLTVTADAKAGEAEFVLNVAYYMCTEETCLPAADLEVAGKVRVTAAAGAPEGILFEPDLVYGKGGDQDLRLDLSRPKDAKSPLPVVVVIHGGGWKGGHRKLHDDFTWTLAQHGYAAATVEYRLCPKDPWPAQVEDVKCAVRFLRANAAKYGLEAKRFGAVGFSAGAHLAMLLGTVDDPALEGKGGSAGESSKVQAAVSFFGPTDLLAKDLPEASLGILKELLGGTQAERADAYRAASPVTHVSAGDAPIFLLQGTKDPIVPATQATVMAEALKKAGVKARCEIIDGAGHGWKDAELTRTLDETYEFLDAELKGAK
jgi:acetyl esterase/lipase